MDRTLLTALEDKIKENAPNFEVKFKDESPLMKFISKILFFNKAFANRYITTIGEKVYWPTRKSYEKDPDGSFNVLAHEYVHIMDYKAKPIRFMLGYLFPQILAAPGILFILLLPILLPLMILSLISPAWLLLLLTLPFIAPIPSPGRCKTELRGYGMSCRTRVWRYGSVLELVFERYVGNFTGPAYYYMWPFKEKVEKKLNQYTKPKNPEFLSNDPNPAWKDVYNVLKDHGALR